MCELAQGCSPLLLPLAARRCCCLELAAAAARRSAAAAEARALGAGGLGGRLRAAALVGDRYAVRFLGAAACEELKLRPFLAQFVGPRFSLVLS